VHGARRIKKSNRAATDTGTDMRLPVWLIDPSPRPPMALSSSSRSATIAHAGLGHHAETFADRDQHAYVEPAAHRPALVVNGASLIAIARREW
jgi:hypothetical protein